MHYALRGEKRWRKRLRVKGRERERVCVLERERERQREREKKEREVIKGLCEKINKIAFCKKNNQNSIV